MSTEWLDTAAETIDTICDGENVVLMGKMIYALAGEREALRAERDSLLQQRHKTREIARRLIREKDELVGERDSLLAALAVAEADHQSACEHLWLTYKAAMSLTDSDEHIGPQSDKPWEDVERRIEALNDAVGQGDALYMAWTIIANANGGDWSKADPEWVAAAERWRDEFHRLLLTSVVPKRSEAELEGKP